MYFSLWNNTPRKPMTEEFQINLNKSGVPVDILQEHKLTTIVKDVEQNDIDLGLLLVCRVIRKGKLVEGDTKKATNIQDYRRPFAVGVVNLQPDIIKQDKIDISMPFFYCAETLYSTIIDCTLCSCSFYCPSSNNQQISKCATSTRRDQRHCSNR